MGGLAIAGAVSAALVRRERTGEPSVVDVSLLATAMWQVSPLVVAAKLFGFGRLPAGDRTQIPNPGVNTYRTSDDRFISLILLQSDKHWDDLCERLDRPDLATDPVTNPLIVTKQDRRFITLGAGLLIDKAVQADVAWTRGTFEVTEGLLGESNTVNRAFLGINYRF